MANGSRYADGQGSIAGSLTYTVTRRGIEGRTTRIDYKPAGTWKENANITNRAGKDEIPNTYISKLKVIISAKLSRKEGLSLFYLSYTKKLYSAYT